MPAKSKSQQRLFGMALAVRKGEMKRSDVWKEVLDIVDSDMTDKEIEDFASTPHKGLKERFENMKDIKQYINETSHPGQEAIEVDEQGKFGYMYYDPNSGIVSTYAMDRPQDIIDDYGYDDAEAWRLIKLRVGQSYTDDSGAIYTRIW